MRIKSFEVSGLLGRKKPLRLDFHEDINILTGRNGAGKTSVLKLIWYIISGNILLALQEVNFQKVTIETDEYTCTVVRTGKATCRVEMSIGESSRTFEDERDEDGDIFINAEDGANPVLMKIGRSVFLPTFRRIEGGFSLTTSSSRPGIGTGMFGNALLRPAREKNDVEDGLTELARKLTNKSHLFITAISTVDISSILLKTYTDLSELYNSQQRSMSQEIVETIRGRQPTQDGGSDLQEANELLDSIRQKIEQVELNRTFIMAPIEAIQSTVTTMFKHSGIKFNERLSFGDAALAVNSDSLSAGEKQMLSFISYNGLYEDAVFLIDEPELSLHVDWQRQLFPTLIRQQSSNQFIMATHSPFIYGKYPDKELQIDPDRGDTEAELHG
ncbi:AAA family ATPase [Sphingorhabdus sp.]|jgi:predicted ATP-binding protein involved in virulence|uniref:AAA family ATPase n=1 Tax=Sphingorhabdus sp. TaxID=1902408 RepID=UPI0037C6EC19